jgi:predicted enzyme related to lactoylglutathione lyase
MERIQARFVGVELYFENLERAKKFYIETMGLEVSDEQVGMESEICPPNDAAVYILSPIGRRRCSRDAC